MKNLISALAKVAVTVVAAAVLWLAVPGAMTIANAQNGPIQCATAPAGCTCSQGGTSTFTCTNPAVGTGTCNTGPGGQCTVVNACGTFNFANAGPIPNGAFNCTQVGGIGGRLASVVNTASQVGTTAVNTQMRNIRDRLQAKRPAAAPRMNFAADPEPQDLPEWAMAYTKAPVFKAPRPAPVQEITWNFWAQGFYDHERRTETEGGVDYGRRTRTSGGIGGIDLTKAGGWILPADYMVVGLLSGYTEARVRNADASTATVKGPSVGYYSIWINGGFSWDSTFKVDLFDLDTSVAPFTGLELRNYSSSNNLNYKFDMQPWWFEPTIGVTFSRLVWGDAAAALGLTDGRQTRIQGGARVGTSWMWNTVRVDPTLTALAYSDVQIQGGTIAGVITAGPSDENKVFGQLIGKLGFDWGRGVSSFVEGEVRGRSDIVGTAVRGGLRVQLN